jgi:hypothetical protein
LGGSQQLSICRNIVAKRSEALVDMDTVFYGAIEHRVSEVAITQNSAPFVVRTGGFRVEAVGGSDALICPMPPARLATASYLHASN